MHKVQALSAWQAKGPSRGPRDPHTPASGGNKYCYNPKHAPPTHPPLPARGVTLNNHQTTTKTSSCQRADGGGEDPKKGTQQLEVYALEIQMATEQVWV